MIELVLYINKNMKNFNLTFMNKSSNRRYKHSLWLDVKKKEHFENRLKSYSCYDGVSYSIFHKRR